MFPRDRNDWPLFGAIIAVAVIAAAAWLKSGIPSPIETAGASTVASAAPDTVPADYGAPPLPGTTATPVPKAGTLVDIVRDPADLPPPVGSRGPRRVTVDLHTEEVTGTLADGTTFHYWTFNGKVPGPFVRVRVGDEVTVRLTNDPANMMMHNVDFHAVLGPGGGGAATAAGPGETKTFTFKAAVPGLFVYHCATMPHAEHIANGMYGLILVEPAGGLPKVDHEYYVMQGEIYTDKPYGTQGLLGDSYAKLIAETPEYYVFNGAVGALTDHKPLRSRIGDTVRIFFGDAGPNKISSFHAIGNIFDRVYEDGSLLSPPKLGVQTTLVPPGGATVVEFRTQVPGKYLLVDHAIARVERGLAGALIVDGPKNEELFKADAATPPAMKMQGM
jgi:nitrite reductase (NO-forming)